ncbi:MAG: HAMP domain-containing sensor histidine kinase [Propionibacteriaceae bacterium]|nr:HAMP domain-containing sensor histidine kinase [Propionibacteriaceae bacterium]
MTPMPPSARPDRAGGAPAGTPRRGRIRRGSIRWRLTAGVMALLVVILSVVGGSLYTVMRTQIHERVTIEQGQVVEELALLAQGADPATGQPFDAPGPFLRLMLQRTALAPNEGILGIVDGRIEWMAPEGAPLRAEDDDQLSDHLKGLSSGDDVVDGTLTTDLREYHYTVAPVVFVGNPERGALAFVTDMRAERSELGQMMRDYLWVALGSLLVASVVVAVAIGRLMRPISSLRDTAAAISETDLSERVPVRGDDELADLATTVNQMLDRIESAVTSQRTLLDDVGHELRTPITVVRGHLELMDVADPADVRSTRAVAIEELDRMGSLITDLILLAKASQPDFLSPQSTDIADLTDAVFTKARALGDRRWLMSRVADAVAQVDPDRITQAWLQLAANAVKYSDPGSTIQIGSRESLGEVYLWVADQGIGIAPEDLAVVKSRFGRAAGVRKTVDGSGLGLAIVDSIAQGHHGRLDISSTLGMGSTFTIVIPVSPSPTQGES